MIKYGNGKLRLLLNCGQKVPTKVTMWYQGFFTAQIPFVRKQEQFNKKYIYFNAQNL